MPKLPFGKIRYSPPSEDNRLTFSDLWKSNPYGYQNRYQIVKHKTYYPARISKGKKWYVSFQYQNPGTGKMEKFKVCENINRIHDEDEKAIYAHLLVEAVDRLLAEGFNPFEQRNIEEYVEKRREPKKWTVGQSLNYFKQKLPELGIRKKSAQTYGSVLKMLNKNLASVLHRDITELNKTHLQGALANNGWSGTTYNNNLRITKRIFNFLIDAEILKDNPAARIKPLPETISKHKYFDDKTWKKIKDKADPELLEFIMFLYHTGIRPNEARQIKYEDIQGDKLFIGGKISKNRKDAFVPISEYIQKKYKRGKGLIFGGGVNYFGNKFQEVKKELKLGKDFTLYSIKATRAVHLAKDGVSPYAIMSLFRHSSLEMTQRYLRGLGLEINREAAEKGIRF